MTDRVWRRVPLVLAALAVAGIGVSSYLAYTHLTDTRISCGVAGDCNYVNSSDYAYIAGIPLSVLGIFMYAGLLGAALLWAVRPSDDRMPILYWGMTLAGAGYAAYLTYVELEILHAICQWCVVSAIILTTGLLLSTAALIWAPSFEEDDEVRSRQQESGRPDRAPQRRPSSPR